MNAPGAPGGLPGGPTVYRVWRGVMQVTDHPNALQWARVEDYYDPREARQLVDEMNRQPRQVGQIVFLIITEHPPEALPRV